MSSTASNVSVTPAVASSPWPQTPAATQDNAQGHSGGPNTPPAAAAAAAVVGGSATASAKSALPFVDAKTVASSQDASVPSATSDASNASAAQDVKDAASAQDAKIAVAAQDVKVAVPAQTKVATPAQGAKPTAAGRQTSPANSNDPIANVANAVAGSPAEVTDGQPWNGSSTPQAQTRADGDTIMPVQSGGSAATHVDVLTATPASAAGSTGLAQLLH